MSLPTIKKVRLPAVFANYDASEAASELSAGVTAGFPIISYRGKVWRVRKGGNEENYVNEDGDAMPSIEVVIIRAKPQLSKLYYEKGYEEGSNEKPRCWSSDSVRPDAEVTEPLARACGACPMNQWGSGNPTPSGGRTRACSDSRRVAVVFRHDLTEKLDKATPLLLRIPAGSLNSLKEYGERVLAPRGILPFSVGTKIGFDAQVAHPKLTFRATSFLTDEEGAAVLALRESEEVLRILAKADELAAAGTTEDADREASNDAARPADAAPAAASASKKARPRPVEEEEDDEVVAPAPAPKAKKAAPAPVTTSDEDDDEVPAPAPAPKAKKAAPAPVVDDDDEVPAPAPASKAKKAAPVPAVEDDDDAPSPPPPKAKKADAAPAAGTDFDSMLDSILKS